MAKTKSKTEIEVVSIYDGDLDLTAAFTSLIAAKISDRKCNRPLVKEELIVHNIDKVPNHTMSGLCG